MLPVLGIFDMRQREEDRACEQPMDEWWSKETGEGGEVYPERIDIDQKTP